MKAIILPNDPLIAYIKKGEIKERYFNPMNVFDEIHFITFSKIETTPDLIWMAAGKATVVIHRFDPLTLFDMFFPGKTVKKVLCLAKQINADIVRSYNPIYQGYFAGIISQELNIPHVLSLHGNYDLDIRYQYFIRKDLRLLKYLLTKVKIEKYALKSASKIIGAYEFAARYALENGVEPKNVEVIYNRVYLNRFRPLDVPRKSPFIKVLCVGRLIEEKGQRTLISALSRLAPSIALTLVGDGEDFVLLNEMVSILKLEDRVTFIKSIKNEDLAAIYQEHDIFAIPIKYGGICIPALEATASGLALVMPKPIHEERPEIVWEYAEVVDNTPEGFAEGINKLANDAELRSAMIAKGLSVIKKYSGAIMEQKEADLYLGLLNKDS